MKTDKLILLMPETNLNKNAFQLDVYRPHFTVDGSLSGEGLPDRDSPPSGQRPSDRDPPSCEQDRQV